MSTSSAVNQLGSIFSPVIDGQGHPIAGANVGIAQPVSISSASAQAGLATLTFTGNPGLQGFATGGTIMVAGFTGADAGFNVGDFDQGTGIVNGATILAVTATQIIYAAPNASGTATSNGTVLQMGNAAMPPAGLVPLWLDPQLTEPQPNPFGTDGGGNWDAFVGAAGYYYVQFYSRAITTTLRLAYVGVVIPIPPIITSLSPSSGMAGTTVTITGAQFGAILPQDAVLFNGVLGSITSWSDTSIVAVAPAGVTTGDVTVVAGFRVSNGVTFTVTTGAPSIASLTPASGAVGATVTITGSNFGATQGSSTITFNGIAATAATWSSTSITAAVPAGATSGNVVVTVNGIGSNGVPFTVTGVTPSITSLSPNSGLVGTSVTISGTNFGLSMGTSTLFFGSTPAIPSTWGNTSIIAPVPSGATTGNVVVTVGGVASNGVTFTVTTAANPVITSLNPATGPVGTSVTIVGTGFDSSGTITFGGIAVTPIPSSWTSTQIVFLVPTGATTPGPVVVTVGGVASAGATFTVTTAASLPVTMSLASIAGGITLPTPGTYAGQPGISLFLTAPWSPSVALAVGNNAIVSGTSYYDGQYVVAGISPGTNGPDNYGMSLVAAGNIQSTVIVGQGTLKLP